MGTAIKAKESVIGAVKFVAVFVAAIGLIIAFSAFKVPAQKRYSLLLPVGKTIKLQILNREGTVTVEGWEKEQVQITAYFESGEQRINPQVSEATIVINIVKENQGRSGLGSVNFNVKVPTSSSVDIETVIGNLLIANVRGSLVRASISTEGDITLTNISASSVTATNLIGDIFFDGELRPEGFYRFASTRGNINLRIPVTSSFRLTATAPSTRSIALGSFINTVLNTINDGRRVIGKFGEGAANLVVTNQRGSISFIPR